MTLQEFGQVVGRCAAAGKALSEAVAGTDTRLIEDATENLGLRILEMQRALPRATPALRAADPATREAWRKQLEKVAEPLKVGAELSTLNTATASARLSEVAHLAGAGLSYSNTGQWSR